MVSGYEVVVYVVTSGSSVTMWQRSWSISEVSGFFMKKHEKK